MSGSEIGREEGQANTQRGGCGFQDPQGQKDPLVWEILLVHQFRKLSANRRTWPTAEWTGSQEIFERGLGSTSKQVIGSCHGYPGSTLPPSDDLYVHADLHGATSVVIKNPNGRIHQYWSSVYLFLYWSYGAFSVFSSSFSKVVLSHPRLWTRLVSWLCAIARPGRPKWWPVHGGSMPIR